jgi:hypothetical protein
MVARVAIRRHVLDLEGDHVAGAQLAVDRQIEHGEVSGATQAQLNFLTIGVVGCDPRLRPAHEAA